MTFELDRDAVGRRNVVPVIFCRVSTFIRYIGGRIYVCVRYSEGFLLSSFCSIHFTETLAGMKNIVRFTEDFVI